MAIPAAVVGALKTALKAAAKKVAEEAAKQGVKAAASAALKEAGRAAMTDIQAALLNRLKSAPSKVLFDLAAREMGLPVKEIRQIVKVFKQTPKMADLAKGQNFKEFAKRTLKNKLDIKGTDKIKDIMRRAEEYNSKKREEERKTDKQEEVNYNLIVKGQLKRIKAELMEKVHGVMRDSVDQKKKKIRYNVDVMEFYDANAKYSANVVNTLEKIISNLTLDAELYSNDTGGDLFITRGGEDEGGEWQRYSQTDIEGFIDEKKQEVALALSEGV